MPEQEIPSSFPPPLPEPPEAVIEELVFDARTEPVTPGGPPSMDAPVTAAPAPVPPIPTQPGAFPPAYPAPAYPAPGYPISGYPAPGSAAPTYADPVSAAPNYGAPVSAPGYATPVSAAPVYGAPAYPAPGGYAAPGSVPPGYAPPGYAPGSVPPGYAPPGYAPGSVPPGYAPPGFGGPGFMPPPPPRRKKTWLFVGIGLVVLLLCAGIGVVLVAIGNAATKDRATAGSTTHPTATAVPTIAPPPPPDPTTLNGSLALQAAALVAGDQAGWMAAVDPKAAAAVAEYQRIFHNLRAMKVASWVQASSSGAETAGPGLEPYNVAVTFCLVAKPCNNLTITLPITAELVAGRVVIKSISVPKRSAEIDQPFPWLVANLSVMTGPRVIVAASSAEASHLSTALHAAEESAAVADKFAHWNRPDVYIVYLASVKEAGTWLGGLTHASNYTGSADPVTYTDIESLMVMPNALQYSGPGGIAQTMRWTFSEAATEYGSDNGVNNDSFTAGLAAYASGYGHTSWLTGELHGVRSFVRSSKWNKSVYLTKELSSSNQTTRDAASGVGYYAITRMIQKYGLNKTLDFWGYVERTRESLQTASTLAFGVSWTVVNADCVAYVKSKA